MHTSILAEMRRNQCVRLTTLSVTSWSAALASESGRTSMACLACWAWALARSRVRCMPFDLRTRSRAWEMGDGISWIGRIFEDTYNLHVARLLEFSGDEGPHLGVFFPSIQSWTCGETELEVGPTRFAEGGLSCFVIKDVVDELEEEDDE